MRHGQQERQSAAEHTAAGPRQPDEDELAFLDKFGAWMALNGEAIYSTRPWKTYGEGPTQGAGGSLYGGPARRFVAGDIRFTTKGRRSIRDSAGLARAQSAAVPPPTRCRPSGGSPALSVEASYIKQLDVTRFRLGAYGYLPQPSASITAG